MDGVGYQHKYNPFDGAKSVKSMTWWQRSEGSEPLCSAKDSHTKSGGRIVYFILAASFNKRVILYEQGFEKISGVMFADFVHKNFKEVFEKSSNRKKKLFLQDHVPSQNNNSMYKVGAKKFSIPARNLDMKPVENVFNKLCKNKITWRIS